ncbi:MAG: phosphoribosylpyrophosphate synthetase [Pseudomonadota bacterium]
MNLSDLQEDAIRKGFTHHFSHAGTHVTCDGKDTAYQPCDLTLVHSNSVDNGTDPGDDATLYLIEAPDGIKGTMIVPSSFYTDPEKADLIDHLQRPRR